MSYTVTVRNDSRYWDGYELIHTWLVLTDENDKHTGFGYFPASDAGTNGAVDDSEKLWDRHYTESVTLEISFEQYEQLIKNIGIFKHSPPDYKVIPNDKFYNCTVAADAILKSAGINYLDGVQTPYGVAGRIKGFSVDLSFADKKGGNERPVTLLEGGMGALTTSPEMNTGDKTGEYCQHRNKIIHFIVC